MSQADYYLFTSKRGEYPNAWCWEIQRKGQPMGIKLTANGFKSNMAAQFASKKALADFLVGLTEEEKRSRHK